jgi:hypothetical protein
MNTYIFLMHNDASNENSASESDWGSYIGTLRESGSFLGGSEIGAGVCVSKAGLRTEVTSHLSGYIKVQAADLEAAKRLVSGNPVFEAGGTIEIRELPLTD